MNSRNLEATAILDFESSAVHRFLDTISPQASSAIAFLRAAHARVSEAIQPVFTVQERQAVSVTFARGRGSCSQRLACLEAVARSRHIGTRVRALWVSGRFWHRRFPVARLFIPRRILLAWPEFFIDDGWLGVEEIFGALESRAANAARFANDGATLFEAVRSTAVDFHGKTRTCSSSCDLSEFVLGRFSVFDARDDLFGEVGSFEDTWKGRAFELLYGGTSSRHSQE